MVWIISLIDLWLKFIFSMIICKMNEYIYGYIYYYYNYLQILQILFMDKN